MDTTKKSSEQVPFLERPIVRTILPIAGFVIICVLFAFLTDGRLFQPKNISLLLSQSYMLLISSIGVFMVMTMGGLDFFHRSLLPFPLQHGSGSFGWCNNRRTDRTD